LSSLFRHWPVRWRIAGISAGLTLVILVCFALAVGRLASDRLRSDFRDEVQTTAKELAIDFTRNFQLGDADEVMDRILTQGDEVIRLVDGDGHAVGNTPTDVDLGAPLAEGPVRVGDYEVASEFVFTTGLAGPGPIYVQYAQNHDSLDATIGRLWLFLAGGVLGGTGLALLAGLAVAGRAMRPIAGLTAAAREIATTRDPSRRLPMPQTEDEVAELAQTLDQMLRELDAARSETEQMIQSQREFVADASHELRTPLTSILANLELLEASLEQQGAGADPDEVQIVAGALGSSRRMRRLVSDLLLLARADAGRSGLRRSCDLAAIGTAALAEVRPVADGHRLAIEAAEDVWVEGNPDDLHRLALNLVENAVRHTPAGTAVELRIGREDEHAVLEVRDDGPGLPEGPADQLFARFVRGGGPADLVRDSGTGLGLAIVKAVAISHGGEVEAGRTAAGGARFTVRLPLAEPATEPIEPAPVV
jgi:signal transduction histidine kinase